MLLPKLQLKKNEERRILAGHLWIYSNEIDTASTPLHNFKPGDLVTIINHNLKELAIGYINPNNLLCVRLLTRNCDEAIDQDFFNNRVLSALKLREKYFAKPYYRLIFSESDFLPGLIVDRFHETLVLQINAAGMEQFKSLIIEALLTALKPKHILMKNDCESRLLEGLASSVEPAFGHPSEIIALEENGLQFQARIYTGQKTGWFFDHSYNRSRLANYARGKRVLDVFSYLGGWGIHAAHYEASEVICIDSSMRSLELLLENAKLNQTADQIKIINDDAFDALLNLIENKEQFGVIILDPPAFIKKRKDLPAGLKAYERLNRLALRLLEPNGILFTSSCSMHLTRDDLLNILRKASLTAEKPISIIEQLHQAQDHPIHPAIEETEYLKGFVAYLR